MEIKFTATRISLGKEWCGVHYTTGIMSISTGCHNRYCKKTDSCKYTPRDYGCRGTENHSNDDGLHWKHKLRIFQASLYTARAKAAVYPKRRKSISHYPFHVPACDAR